MFVIGLIIVLIIVWTTKNNEINRLMTENKKLKEKLNNYEKKEMQILKTANEEADTIKNEKIEQLLQKEKKQVERTKHIEHVKTKYDEKEKKNVSILITGAICIVLAAIVFLISTWATIPNILKTMILVLLTVVFFVGSYIAENKYKLSKASKVFYYIGMAYIPICLFSISIFSLLGEYLSFWGDGKNIYFAFAALIVAIIYYINRKDKCLLVGSILSQVLTVVLFSVVFSDNSILILINLVIYNILLIILTKDKIFKMTYNVLPWIAVMGILMNLGNNTIEFVCLQGVLAINFLVLEIKRITKVYAYMFNLTMSSCLVHAMYLGANGLTDKFAFSGVLVLLMLMYIVETLILEYKKNDNLLESLSVVTIGMLSLQYIINMIKNIIPLHIIAVQLLIILVYFYIKCDKKFKNILEFLIPICVIVIGVNIMNMLKLTYHIYIIFGTIVFAIGEAIRNKNKSLHFKWFVITQVYLLLAVAVSSIYNGLNENWIYTILLLDIYIYSYIIERKSIFKYFAYIASNFVIYSIVTSFEYKTDQIYYVPMITTLGIMCLEKIIKQLRDKGSNVYLAVSEVIAFLFIYKMPGTIDKISTILGIIMGIIILISNRTCKISNIVTLICMLPAVFSNSLDVIISNIVILASVTAVTVTSIRKKDWSEYTIISVVYLLFGLINLETIYVKEIMFLCWSILHYLAFKKEKQKDVFKFMSCIGILFIYNTVIEDLNINNYILFSMAGYLIVTIVTLRGILIKYIKELDIYEYIIYVFLYLIAVANYNDEIDGILFVSLLVVIIIVSYIKKYGVLFITTILAMLANVFLLTRLFWFSIPWWAYLLTIGVVLIGFAIKNETNDKKNTINPIKMIKKLQEKIENK